MKKLLLLLLWILYPGQAQQVDWVNNVKNKPFLDVRFYGATCNGLHEDTSGIQKALDAAATAGGGLIWLPPGDCNLGSNGRLHINSSNITIAGVIGVSRLISFDTTSSDDLITMASDLGSVTLRDFNIIMSTTKSTGYAINEAHANAFKMYNVRIDGAPFGIFLNNCTECLFEDVIIFNLFPTTGEGFTIQGLNVDDVFFNRVTTSTANGHYKAGIRVYQSGYISLHSVNTLVANSGLLLTPGAGQVEASVEAVESHFDTDGQYGIVIAPTGGGAAVRNKFTGSWSSSAGIGGVLMDTTQNGGGIIVDTLFDGHSAKFNQQSGFLINGPGITNTQIVNSSITDNNKSLGAGSTAGVAISSNINNILIQNNVIGTDGVGSATQAFGIFINSGTGSNILINNNNLTGNTNTGLIYTTLGTNNIFTNNLGANPIGTTSPTCSASPCTLPATISPVPSTLYIVSGTFTTATINGVTICSTAPCSIQLASNQQAIITYSGTTPVFALDTH